MGFRLIISDYTQELVPNLPDAEAAWLLRALVRFAQSNGEELPREIPPALAIVWPAVEKRQRALLDSYNHVCEVNRANGRAGGLSKARHLATASDRQRPLATASKSKQPLATAKQKEKEKEKEREKVFPEVPKSEEPKSTEAEVPVEKNNPKSEVPKPKPEVTTIAPARVKPAAKPPSPSGTSGHRTSVEISSIESLRPKGEKWAEDYEDPVDFALAVTGEPNTLQARYCYGSYLRDLGPSEFNEVVRTFQAEVRAGEVPRNIAACLNARLKDRRAVLLSLRKADADRASKTA